MDLTFSSLKEIRDAIAEKKVSSLEVTRHYLNRIQKLDSQLNSFVFINKQAEKDASEIDAKIAKGEKLGALAGVPIGIKDMLCTKGLETTAASKILKDFIPPYDSTVVAKLKAAGSLVIGKTNQDEFAMGSSNETSVYGVCKNPWNTKYVPGGSSGGSAAAQAARLAAATIGTDTGGSIRQPASFCGVVGVKPTYGRVSRYGIVAFASSLDQAGPLTSTVEDSALILEAICGHDPKDSTTSSAPVPQFSASLKKGVKGLKVGLMKEYDINGLAPDTRRTVEAAIDALKKQGAEFVEVSVPLVSHAVPIYYLVASSEASSNLARYDGVRYGRRADFSSLSAIELDEFYARNRGEGFGSEVKRRIMLGTYCLSSGYYDAYYTKAGQVRRLLRDQYSQAFQKCDVILSAVTTSPAFKIGERISDPLAMYLNDIFTTSTNLAGLPGASIPFGFSADGLPIGVQLTTAHYQEETLLQTAHALELSSTISERRPHVV
ncbi:MAG: Asp-tRNA(Asn)/Glu-tRNA(Gln) amidotransferase subunit GatA [Pseudobdellovibrionaceae bacterium]